MYSVQGAKIGSNCYIDTLNFTDLEQLEIKDNVTVDEGVSISCHSFKDRSLHFAKVGERPSFNCRAS